MADVRHSDAENREITIGTSDRNRVLIVFHVSRGKSMRIIGVRRATRRTERV